MGGGGEGGGDGGWMVNGMQWNLVLTSGMNLG